MRPDTDRRRKGRRAALAVLLLVLFAGAWWWTERHGDVEPAPTVPPPNVEAPGAPPSLAAAPRELATAPDPTAEPRPEGGPANRPPYVIEFLVKNIADDRPVPGLTFTASWAYGEPVESPDGAGMTFRLKNQQVSAATDAEGLARVEAPPPLTIGPTGVVVGRDWSLFRLAREGSAPEEPLRLDATRATRIVVWVRRVFWLSGRVVDSEGRPLPGARATFMVPQETGAGFNLGSLRANSDAAGRFDIGPFAEDAGAGFHGETRRTIEALSFVTFSLPGLAVTLLDPRAIPADRRDAVVVTMTAGTTLAGTLVDVRGRPIADAPVAVEYGTIHDLRRGTRTDTAGRWRLDHLSTGRARLLARAFAQDAKASRDIVVERDDLDVRLQAEEIRLSRSPRTVRVLGLELCDVDDELRAAYEVPEGVRVLIFDPGPEPEGLGIGRLQRGYGLSVVGEEQALSVRDAIEKLLKEPNTPNDSLPGRKRVVYTFWNENMAGTNTQYVTITEQDRARLSETLGQLSR